MLNCDKTLLMIALVLGLLSFQTVQAKTLDWDKLKSEFLEFNDTRGRDPSWLRAIVNNPGWYGANAGLASEALDKVLSPSCDLRSEQVSALQPVESWSKNPTQLWSACESQWQKKNLSFMQQVHGTMLIRLDLNAHPFIKRVVFSLPNGFKQPALLAMKDTNAARPLIIARAGIFGSSVDVQAERYLLMQLFEESPFNFIFLDSLSSSDVVSINDHYSSVGMDEGLINYQIARSLQLPKEPMSHFVDGVHLVAVSMGGHGLFQSLILDRFNPPMFLSATAICPLVQYYETVQTHRQSLLFYPLINFWTYLRLEGLRSKIPSLTITDLTWNVVKWIDQNWRSPLTQEASIHFPPQQDTKHFLEGNNLVPLLSLIQTPITVFATETDPVVPYSINYQKLVELKKQGHLEKWNLLSAQEGIHCSFPSAYSWDQFGALLRSSVLANHPKWSARISWEEFMLKADLFPKDWRYKAEVGSDHLQMTAEPDFEIQVPISKIDWATSEKIRNRAESEAVIRWLRQNGKWIHQGSQHRFRFPVLN